MNIATILSGWQQQRKIAIPPPYRSNRVNDSYRADSNSGAQDPCRIDALASAHPILMDLIFFLLGPSVSSLPLHSLSCLALLGAGPSPKGSFIAATIDRRRDLLEDSPSTLIRHTFFQLSRHRSLIILPFALGHGSVLVSCPTTITIHQQTQAQVSSFPFTPSPPRRKKFH